MKGFAQIAAAVLLLVGCAQMKQSEERRLTTVQRLGIVSLLGDTFHGTHIGITVFENVNFDVAVPAWRIDAHVEDVLARHVRGRHGLEAARIQLPAELRAKLLEPANPLLGRDFSPLFAEARRQGFSTVLLVRSTAYQNDPLRKPGFGYFQRRSMVGVHGCAYGLYILGLYNAETADHYGWERGPLYCQGAAAAPTFKDRWEDYPVGEREMMREQVKERLGWGVVLAFDEAYRIARK